MEAFSAWLLTVFIFFRLADEPPPVPAGKETIVLLPDAEGRSTGIVVRAQGREIAVTEPYQGVELAGGKAESKAFSAAQVRNLFPGVMQALPDPPRTFTLHFEQNGTRLTAESAAMVDAVRLEIVKRPAPEVTVIGHTDREGPDDANLRLSQSRAEAMRDILVSGGVPAQIIQVVGRGEIEPAVMTADGVAEPRNRRVEISVR